VGSGDENAHPVSLRSLYLWRMPEMVAPRALVFRPLVKGNEDLENEIGDGREFESTSSPRPSQCAAILNIVEEKALGTRLEFLRMYLSMDPKNSSGANNVISMFVHVLSFECRGGLLWAVADKAWFSIPSTYQRRSRRLQLTTYGDLSQWVPGASAMDPRGWIADVLKFARNANQIAQFSTILPVNMDRNVLLEYVASADDVRIK